MKIYYVSNFSFGHAVQCYTTDNEQQAKEYLESYDTFVRYATKQEFDSYCFNKAMEKMKPAIETDDLKYIFEILRPNWNPYSRKCFEILTGIKLSKTSKVRIQQLKDYYGEKYLAWQKQEEQKALNEKEAQSDTILVKFKAGDKITGVEFVSLCDRFNINLPIRSRGFCLNKIQSIDLAGNCRFTAKKLGQGAINAYFELKNFLDR